MERPNLQSASADALLRLFGDVLEELRRRKLVRSNNNPVADFSEQIAAECLGLKLESPCGAGHDGMDNAGSRFQVKGRRLTAHNKSRQLSFIRDIDSKPFDFLVGILFDAEFHVLRACVVPFEVVRRRCTFSKKVKAHRLILRDDVWDEDGVQDITTQATDAAAKLCEVTGECSG